MIRSLFVFALLVCAVMPVPAQSPTVDQLLEGYARAPWFKIQDGQGAAYVCISQKGSDIVDRYVAMIAERAKGAQCS